MVSDGVISLDIKFFNLHERFAAKLDWSSVKVYEKLDGRYSSSSSASFISLMIHSSLLLA